MHKVLLLLCPFCFLIGCNEPSSDLVEDTRTVQQKLDDIKDVAALALPENASVAESLLYTMGVDKTTRAMFVVGLDANLQTAMAVDPNLDKAAWDKYLNLSMTALEEEIPRFISDASKFYEARYTDEEMISMMEFLKTETG